MRQPATLALLLIASPATGRAETPVERGRYLADIAACTGCHTPRAPGAASMSGGVRFGAGPEAVESANLTPDRDTGIGAWSDAQIAIAIRDGIRPDGTRIRPPMPQRAYHGLTETDVATLVAFLKSLPPVRKIVVRPDHERTSAAAPRQRVVGATANDRGALTRGRYLYEAVTHCADCHTPADTTSSGGKTFKGPHGRVVAPILTPSNFSGLSDAALAAIITQGVRPDGSKLEGPMPVTAYAHLTPDDLAAIVGVLRGAQ